jgi:hypothetical protein
VHVEPSPWLHEIFETFYPSFLAWANTQTKVIAFIN